MPTASSQPFSNSQDNEPCLKSTLLRKSRWLFPFITSRSLPELIRRTTAACESLGKEYEILLIDDGSSDNSAHMLVEASQAEGSHIVSILLNRNYGQHSAIMAGFSHVTGDLIITLDADLQNPPEEIPVWWQKPMKVTTW